MSEPIVLAWIGVIGAILTTLLGKVTWDSHRTRRDTAAVHNSINNRTDEHGNPISISDRLDRLATKDDLRVVREDIGTLFASDSALRKADEEQRTMIRELHDQWAGGE